jgi:FKBP-type peptidyl-prolyl cis-trans isomerase
MNRIIFYAALLCCTGAFGQSKKELAALLKERTAEVEQLKAKVTELEKPKDISLTDERKRISYSLGVLMASNVKGQGADSLDTEAVGIAFRDVFEGKPLKLEQQEAMTMVQSYMEGAHGRKTASMRAGGEKFLAENKTKPGVVTTPSGLQYKILTAGKGKKPTASSNVLVHYTGKTIDGNVFDSSVQRGEPITLGVSGVISGWTEALQLMKEGDKWELYIPYNLAYGERGAGAQIPPYAALIFEVELIKVN